MVDHSFSTMEEISIRWLATLVSDIEFLPAPDFRIFEEYYDKDNVVVKIGGF
jgi:hypothetical protein